MATRSFTSARSRSAASQGMTTPSRCSESCRTGGKSSKRRGWFCCRSRRSVRS